MIRMIKLWVVLILVLSVASGCASFGRKLKALVGGEPEPVAAAHARPGAYQRFSENPDMPSDADNRQYRRMTKDRFEQEALGERSSGSLWVMEGQGSYLFSQNMTRIVGDVLNVRIDGEPKRQLENKAEIIKKLVIRVTKPRNVASAAAAGQPENKDNEKDKKEKDKGKDKDEKKDQKTAANGKEDSKEDEEDKNENSAFGVNVVPARIMERLPDGTYRVKGSQTFMIGKYEYRVIMVGVARPGDINDDTIDSSRLLDSKFDILSQRKELRQ